MSPRVPWYAYAVVLFLGVITMFFMSPSLRADGSALVAGLLISCAVCVGFAAFVGLLWPAKGWAWGFWLAGPVWIVVALSVIFAGGVRLLLLRDLPILVLTTIVECGGAYVGANARRWRARPE